MSNIEQVILAIKNKTYPSEELSHIIAEQALSVRAINILKHYQKTGEILSFRPCGNVKDALSLIGIQKERLN